LSIGTGTVAGTTECKVVCTESELRGFLITTHALNSSVESFNTSAKGLDDFPYSSYLVKLGLQLVDLPQYLLESGDFGVGGLNDVAGAIVLRLRRGLGLLVKLHSLLGIVIVRYVFHGEASACVRVCVLVCGATYGGPTGLN